MKILTKAKIHEIILDDRREIVVLLLEAKELGFGIETAIGIIEGKDLLDNKKYAKKS